jgi:hypothetical protein
MPLDSSPVFGFSNVAPAWSHLRDGVFIGIRRRRWCVLNAPSHHQSWRGRWFTADDPLPNYLTQGSNT